MPRDLKPNLYPHNRWKWDIPDKIEKESIRQAIRVLLLHVEALAEVNDKTARKLVAYALYTPQVRAAINSILVELIGPSDEPSFINNHMKHVCPEESDRPTMKPIYLSLFKQVGKRRADQFINGYLPEPWTCAIDTIVNLPENETDCEILMLHNLFSKRSKNPDFKK